MPENKVVNCIKKTILFLFYCYFSVFYTKNSLENITNFIRGRRIKFILKNGLIINSSRYYFKSALITYEIFYKRIYNPDGFDINSKDSVLDIGGNIGVYTLYASMFTKNRVIVCEPFPANVAILIENIKDNRLRNVIVEPIALGRETKERKLYISELNKNSSFYCLPERKHDYLMVKPYSLEKVMRQHKIKEIGFLKIDCEGAEGEIIKSTSLECLRKIRKIAMEYHDNVSEMKHEAIENKLKKAGFSVNTKGNILSPFGYIYANRSV